VAQAGDARRGRGAHLAALVAIGALAGGCGSTAHHTSVALRAPCAQRVLGVIARDARVAPGAFGAANFTATNGAPACRYRGHALTVVADVDSSPQAVYRLDRQVVEYGQGVIWFHRSQSAYPRSVAGIGVAADWFPAEELMMTTDGRRLISIIVGAGAHSPERIAADAARAYLSLRR
jgi:hypothetical protein